MLRFKNKLRNIKLLVQRSIGRELWYPIQVKCQRLRLGTDYGGWTVCPTNITKDSVVYSFGIGEDITFDLGLIERFGVTIFAFDPSPKSIQWAKQQRLPDEFRFYEYGLADYDGVATFFPPENPNHVSFSLLSNQPQSSEEVIEAQVYRLKTIMDLLGHSRLDVLKMDIEGAEYAAIEDIVSSGLTIGQLLVEFHHGSNNISASLRKTKLSINIPKSAGYKIFDISLTGREFAFLKN